MNAIGALRMKAVVGKRRMVKRRDKSTACVNPIRPPRPDNNQASETSPEANRRSEELEEALDATFPASDPISELSSLVAGRPYPAPKSK